jgi:hypothetical protein
MWGLTVYHLAVGAPAVVGKLQSFLGTATGWVTGLAAAGGGLMFGYHALMGHVFSGGDPQVQAVHQASMRRVLIGTVLVVAASGIAHFVAGFF